MSKVKAKSSVSGNATKEGKFVRAGRGSVNKSDLEGRVNVTIRLLDPSGANSKPLKGNLSKSLTIDKTKVSEVFEAIEKALF